MDVGAKYTKRQSILIKRYTRNTLCVQRRATFFAFSSLVYSDIDQAIIRTIKFSSPHLLAAIISGVEFFLHLCASGRKCTSILRPNTPLPYLPHDVYEMHARFLIRRRQQLSAGSSCRRKSRLLASFIDQSLTGGAFQRINRRRLAGAFLSCCTSIVSIGVTA